MNLKSELSITSSQSYHSFTHLFALHSVICSLTYSFTHSLTHLFPLLFTHSFVHSFIHSSIHPSIQYLLVTCYVPGMEQDVQDLIGKQQ